MDRGTVTSLDLEYIAMVLNRRMAGNDQGISGENSEHYTHA